MTRLVEANMNAIEAVKSAPLRKEGAGESDGRIGAAPGGGSQPAGDHERARRVVGQQAPHLAFRDHRLHDGREEEAENERPEDLPEHPEGERERLHQFVCDVCGEWPGHRVWRKATLTS